jgi:hypothetical protein
MRAFVRLRQMLASNAELARKMDALEQQYDAQLKVVFDAIRQLMIPARAEEMNDRFFGRRKSRRLRPPLAAAYFDVSEGGNVEVPRLRIFRKT